MMLGPVALTRLRAFLLTKSIAETSLRLIPTGKAQEAIRVFREVVICLASKALLGRPRAQGNRHRPQALVETSESNRRSSARRDA